MRCYQFELEKKSASSSGKHWCSSTPADVRVADYAPSQCGTMFHDTEIVFKMYNIIYLLR